MSEYQYKDGIKAGNTSTLISTARFPIVGGSIFKTYDELTQFITDPTSTAYGGATLYVIADPDSSKNGAYEITFKNPTLVDDNNYIKFFNGEISNLQAIKLINANEQGGISDGKVIDGFKRADGTFIRRDGEGTTDKPYRYYNDKTNTEVTDVNDEEKQKVTAYIVLSMTNGDKVYIDASEFKAVANTYITQGAFDNDNKKITLSRNDGQTVEVDLTTFTIEVYEAVITIDETNDTLKLTDNKAGLLTTTALDTIEKYIDNFDCGKFTLS